METQKKSYTTRELYAVQFIPPPLALAPYIQNIEVVATHTFLSGSIPWHIMPDGSSYVIFTLSLRNNQYRSRLVWVGPRTIYKEIDRKERLANIILRFRPGGAFPWLPFPIKDLTDRTIHLSELWGDLGLQLRREMMNYAIKGELKNCVALLTQTLSDQLSQKNTHPIVSSAVQWFYRYQENPSISGAAKKFGISDRYLRKMFLEQVGIGPKKLARIFRVTKAVAQMDKGWALGWSALAHSYGYYDQAHMIDEFQALLGASPEKFIQRKNREEILNIEQGSRNDEC